MRDEVARKIELFLYFEARLLDERRFHEWLGLFTDDGQYWMPVRATRYPKVSKAIVVLDPSRERDEELANEQELAFFRETKHTLGLRIARLDTGMAWAEDPPSRTRRSISNIEVEEGASESEARVRSNFIVHRSRLETDVDWFVGGREDILRRVDGEWKIAQRKIVLNENVLRVKNIGIFF